MLRIRTLHKDVAFLAGGNAIYALCQGLILVALARFGSAEMVGRFTLAIAVSAPLVLFSQLGLRDVIATDAGRAFPIRDYMHLTVATSALAMAMALLLWGLFFPLGDIDVLAGVVLSKVLESISLVAYGAAQRARRMVVVGASLVSRGLLGLVGMLVGLGVGGTLAWAVFGQATAWLVVLIAVDVPALRRVSEARAATASQSLAHRIRPIAALAFPLGATSLLVSLNAAIPRLFLERLVGVSALGVFAAMAYVIQAGAVVAAALGQAMAPRLAESYRDSDLVSWRRAARGLNSVSASAGVFLAAGGLLVGEPLLRLVFGSEFAVERGAFLVLLIYGVALYPSMALSQELISVRRLKGQLGVLVIAVLAVAVGSIALINTWGIRGAAAALLGSGVARLGASVFVLRAELFIEDPRVWVRPPGPDEDSDGNPWTSNRSDWDDARW